MRLAAKASATFIDMTTQAVQRKALLNSLSSCSLSLKNHVKKRNILSRNLLPMGAAELRKLVSAAKIGCQSDDISAGLRNMVTMPTSPYVGPTAACTSASMVASFRNAGVHLPFVFVSFLFKLR